MSSKRWLRHPFLPHRGGGNTVFCTTPFLCLRRRASVISISVVSALKMTTNSLKTRQGLVHSLSCKDFLACIFKYEEFVFKDLSDCLQNCRKHRDNEFSTKLYTCICSNGLETHARLGNFLVPMLVDCGSVLYAQQVFHKMIDRNEYSWTSLMQGHLDHGEGQHAYELFQKMQETSIRPSKFTMQVLLKVCARLDFLEGIHGTHSYFVGESYDGDSFVGNALVHIYATCGLLAEATIVFDKLLVQDVVSWTALVAGYAGLEFITESLHCWEQMQIHGVSPNAFTAASVLAVCGTIEALKKGHEIHSFAVSSGFEEDSFVGNTLVDLYGKCGYLFEAQEVFYKLPVKDEISWAALVTGYAKQGHVREAHECLKQMKQMRIATNLVLWNTLIADFAELGLSEEVLECVKLMEQEGLHPDAITLTICAKACGGVRCLSKGNNTHIEVTKLGYENDNFVAKALVDMYCKCGFFLEAQHLFDKLKVQDIITWTVLIAGYGEHGFLKAAESCLEEMMGKGLSITATTWNALIAAYLEVGLVNEAANCFERMYLERVTPNAATYINVLKSWTAIGSISKGQEIHIEITKEGLENDPFLGTCLIDLYAKCGTIAEAQNIFQNLPHRDKVTWSSFIGALAEHGLVSKCFNSLQAMQMDGVSPNAVACTHWLKACNNAGDLTLVQSIYFQVLEQGLETDVSFGTLLISMYSRYGLLQDAQYVFNILDMRDLCSWNALISGYAEQGHRSKVMECLSKMQQCAVFPGASTYACSLKGGDSIVDLAACQQIHGEIAKDGFERDLSVGNCLIDLYSRYNFFGEAQDVLHEMLIHDEASWTALIAGYAQCMLDYEALRCFKQMQREGLCPKHDTFVWSLKACGSAGDVGQGYGMHCEILKLGLERVSFVGNSLVEMYIRFGSLLEAQQVFDMLPTRNVVSWNTIITGCAENGLYIEALEFAKRIQVECLPMDDITVIGILKTCMYSGALHMGQIIHAEVAKRGYEDNFAVSSSLVGMYVKGGLLNEAWEVFKKLLVKDVLLWTVLISGYACQGDSEAAFVLFKKMKDTGILPDGVTFLSLLTVCSHAGLVDEGQDVCNFLNKRILATLEHYNCLIDLFARAGQLIKASALVKCLPLQPNFMSWTTILGACRKWGAEELGELAFSYADELAGNQPAPYILLFSLFTTSCDNGS